MRVNAASLVVICIVTGLNGCGGGDGRNSSPQEVETHISSDPAYDGDIEQTPTSYIVTQGMQGGVESVLAGIDPSTGDEFRAFLDFPLDGADGVPGNAIIDSATLTVLLDDLTPPDSGLPVRVELVSFQPPSLGPSQFDRTAQPSLGAVVTSEYVTGAEIGQDVTIDVTPLMVTAQQLGLIDFQLRIMEDLGPPFDVLMQIDDTIQPDRPQRAPELAVTYH